MKENKFKITGEAVIKRIKDNKVIEITKVKNLVVNSGLEQVAKLLNGVSTTPFKYIAIGTDNTAAASGQTALQSEITRAQAEDGGGSYEADYKAKLTKTFSFGSGESYTITEAGVFDSATPSGSTMLDRVVFTGQTVDADTSLQLTVTITVATV